MALTQPYSPSTPSVMRTSRGEIPVPEHMALADFEKLDWPEDDRWELTEGVPCLSPSGMPEHQDLMGVLYIFLVNKLDPRGYRILTDIDIAFPGQESCLRPDISVFAADNLPKPTVLPVRELPSLVVELLSRSTASNDLGPKLSIHERAGVSEYWTANPATGALTIYTRAEDGRFVEPHADAEGRVRSSLINANLRIIRENGTYRVAD
jgi:Uma2 family endonuclease